MNRFGSESHKETITFERYAALSQAAGGLAGHSVKVAAHEGRPYEHHDQTARAGNLYFSYPSLRPKEPMTVPDGHIYAEITAPGGDTSQLNRLADEIQGNQSPKHRNV